MKKQIYHWMKSRIFLALPLALSLLFWGLMPQENVMGAVFVSGSTGADGAFNPASNVTLQLPPGGVFNFTSVNIPAGVTVTFAKNAANTPVTILATGDVTINGTISVNGSNGAPGMATSPNPNLGIGGPGGYNGGTGGNPGAVNVAAGLGGPGLGSAGGGGGGTSQGCFPASGCGGAFPASIATLLPLLGGSGGGGGAGRVTSVGNSGGAGGGGGGSILIASSGIITLTGSITGNGGSGGSSSDAWGGGGGSGGGMRLVANTVTGGGTIQATGGAGNANCCGYGPSPGGGNGIIRVESFVFTYTGTISPGASFSTPGLVTPPGLPTLTLTSIGGSTPPAIPKGDFSEIDLSLPSSVTNPVAVGVSATNIPVNTGIRVDVRPQFGDVISANGTLSGTQASSSATVNLTFPTGVSVVQIVTSPFTITADLAPFLPIVQGEPVEKIRLAAAYGGGSQVFYITKSGKEVPAENYFGRVMSGPAAR